MSRHRVIDGLIVVLVLSLAATLFRSHRAATAQFTTDDAVRGELRRLHDRIVVRAALENVPRTKAGYPLALPTEWFADGLPRNPLVPIEQPWLEIAPPGDVSQNPDDPVIVGPDQAGIWYNPERGILRARVMPQFSDTETLLVYNRINDTAVTSLPRTERVPYVEDVSPESGADSVSAEVPVAVPVVDMPADAADPDVDAPPYEAPPPAADESPDPDGSDAEKDDQPRRPTLKDHQLQAAD